MKKRGNEQTVLGNVNINKKKKFFKKQNVVQIKLDVKLYCKQAFWILEK